MFKTILKINGMACSMCEEHMNDAIREAFKVKKVTSDHKLRETIIISKTEIPKEEALRVVESLNYKLEGYKVEPAPDGFFASLFKNK